MATGPRRARSSHNPQHRRRATAQLHLASQRDLADTASPNRGGPHSRCADRDRDGAGNGPVAAWPIAGQSARSDLTRATRSGRAPHHPTSRTDRSLRRAPPPAHRASPLEASTHPIRPPAPRTSPLRNEPPRAANAHPSHSAKRTDERRSSNVSNHGEQPRGAAGAGDRRDVGHWSRGRAPAGAARSRGTGSRPGRGTGVCNNIHGARSNLNEVGRVKQPVVPEPGLRCHHMSAERESPDDLTRRVIRRRAGWSQTR